MSQITQLQKPIIIAGSPIKDWTCVALSEDGSKIYAGSSTGLYIGTRSGENYTFIQYTSNVIGSIWCNKEGRNVVFGTYNIISMSNDFGNTWFDYNIFPSYFRGIIGSENSSYFTACTIDSNHNVSIFYGLGSFPDKIIWKPSNNTNIGTWTSITGSSDLLNIFATNAGTGKVAKSEDIGQSFFNINSSTIPDSIYISSFVIENGIILGILSNNKLLISFNATDNEINFVEQTGISKDIEYSTITGNGNGLALVVSSTNFLQYTTDLVNQSTGQYPWATMESFVIDPVTRLSAIKSTFSYQYVVTCNYGGSLYLSINFDPPTPIIIDNSIISISIENSLLTSKKINNNFKTIQNLKEGDKIETTEGIQEIYKIIKIKKSRKTFKNYKISSSIENKYSPYTLLFDKSVEFGFIDLNYDIFKTIYGKCINTYQIVFKSNDKKKYFYYFVNGKEIKSISIQKYKNN